MFFVFGGFIIILILAFSCSDSKTRVVLQQDQVIVLIPPADFMIGGGVELTRSDEFPKHRVIFDGLWMDEAEVTNAQLRKLVQETNYITTAERKPDW